MARICKNIDCRNGEGGRRADLDDLGLKATATSCSAPCRAAASRRDRADESEATRSMRFWRAMEGRVAGRVETPARLRARAQGRTGRVDRSGAAPPTPTA